ncbi:MAG: hypothetical protein ACP5O3_02695 [Candidatus Micrarchaeia archaeon]
MDVRYLIRDQVNELRRRQGKNALQLHEEESANCKAHASFLAEESEKSGVTVLRHADPRFLRDWKESLFYYEGGKSVEEAVAHIFSELERVPDEHYYKLLEAKEFVAGDVVVRGSGQQKKVFLVQRFK